MLYFDVTKHVKYLILILTVVCFFDITFKCNKLQLHYYKCVTTNIFKYMTQVSIEVTLKYILVYNTFILQVIMKIQL